ncbi:MAG: polyprenyl synthetase family protein [Bifidobacteriaceae bacterium]|jgi:heptaprenyl diphosphate synthase|nr:polyprenyl synthetase family protein [Bifidobacteriaceae bacterium]
MSKLKEFLVGVEERLIEITVHKSAFITEVMQHLLLSGGKRVRPTLVYYGSQFTNDSQNTDVSALINAAAAIELCHLGSLYHDDIMDASEFRHQVPSAHIKYGEDIGIVAGDMLFAQSAMLGNMLQKRASTLLSDAFFRLCEGQINETVLEKGEKIYASLPKTVDSINAQINSGAKTPESVQFDEYITIVSGKTSALFSASLTMGAVIANSDDETINSLAKYGENLGIAYQITDDILDIVGESGKSAGLDIKGDVQSIVVMLLKQKVRDSSATASEREANKILQMPNLTDQNIADALCLIAKSSIIDDAREIAQEYTTNALVAISALTPYALGYKTLTEFAKVMLDRVS